MSEVRPKPISYRAAELVLSIMEMPSMGISATALDEYYFEAGAELLTLGALESDGFEPIAVSQADHDDAVTTAAWDGDIGGYGTFSPAIGMVAVEGRTIDRYRLRAPWLVDWIAADLRLQRGVRPVELVPDRVLDLGDVWLGERKSEKRRTTIYLARRLGEPGALARLRAALQSRAGRPPGVILSSSPPAITDDATPIGMTPIMPILRCAMAGIGNFCLDAAIVRTVVHGARPSSSDSLVRVDADFRVIRVGAREFQFRGDKQRQVIRYLHNAWDRGEGPVNTALMFIDLEFPETTRLRDLFKGHADWKDVIGVEAGTCWIRYADLLGEGASRSD